MESNINQLPKTVTTAKYFLNVSTPFGDVQAEVMRNDEKGFFLIVLFGETISRRKVRTVIVKDRHFKKFSGVQDLASYYVFKIQESRGLTTAKNQLTLEFNKAA